MNGHLHNILREYLSISTPRFGILVKGEWGSGKTYEVKRFFEDKQKALAYVSLFDKVSIESVEIAAFTAASPSKYKLRKVAENASRYSKSFGSVGKVASLIPEILSESIRQELPIDTPIIFDDIERCPLKFKDIVGIINFFIEHKGAHVIVIAHDDRIAEELSGRREKLFGVVTGILPNFESAFDKFFLEAFGSHAIERELIRTTVHTSFFASKCQSLRILRYVMYDLRQFIRCIPTDVYEKSDILSELVAVFSSLAFEARLERIEKSHLLSRRHKFIGSLFRENDHQDQETRNLNEIYQRHLPIDITSDIISDEFLANAIFDHIFNDKQLGKHLQTHPRIVGGQNAKSWKVVINFDELDDNTVRDGISQLVSDFKNRAFQEPGDILHMASMLMLLSSQGAYERSFSQIVSDFDDYINEVLDTGALTPRDPSERFARYFDASFDGYGYWIDDAYQSEFRQILSNLQSAMDEQLRRQFPMIARELLCDLHNNGKAFFQKICYSGQGNGQYALIPVLAEIDVDEFVRLWLSSPREHWRAISYGLKERWNYPSNGHLLIEKSWASSLIEALNLAASSESGLDALRIKRTIPYQQDELDHLVAFQEIQ